MSALTDTFTSIADAIRSKTGKSDTITPSQMPSEIEGIQSGGGGVTLGSAKCNAMTLSNSTWETTEFYVSPPPIHGFSIWTDGTNIYYSSDSIQRVLNKSTSTWSTKSWSGLTNFDGRYIWTDGDNIYYFIYSDQYVLPRKRMRM